jgi:hypothetical protein
LYAKYSAAVTFTNDDLMLKTTEHNRPNYVIGEIDNHKVNRILLDPGSSGTFFLFESYYMSFIKGNRLYTNKATKQEADQTDKPKRSPAKTGSN